MNAGDADDPFNILGGRRVTKLDTDLPSAPFRARGALRGLTGDVRRLSAGQTAQLIDSEYDTPRPILIVGEAVNVVAGGPSPTVSWTLRTGLDRSFLAEETQGMGFPPGAVSPVFRRIVTARSLQLTVRVIAEDCLVKFVATPIDVTMPASEIVGMTPTIAKGAPNGTTFVSAPQSVVSSTFEVPAGDLPIFGAGNRQGFAVYNDSPAALYLLLHPVLLASPAFFTVLMVAGSYYEAPYGYTGSISGVWSGVGAGAARVTFFGYEGYA